MLYAEVVEDRQKHPWTIEWQSGMSVVELFRLGGATYVLLVRAEGTAKDGHNVHVLRMNDDGTLGERIDARTWTEGFLHARFFSVKGKPFLFFLKEESGLAEVHALGPDGTLRAEIAQYQWTSGWTSVEFFEAKGETYLLLVKREGLAPSGHDLHVLRMNEDGRVGTRVDMQSVGEGFSQVKPFVVGGRPYVFMLKADTGFAKVRRLSPEGKLGEVVAQYGWEPGWTIAEPFCIGGATYLLVIASDECGEHGHRARVFVMNDDGSVGAMVDAHRFDPGITHGKPFEAGGKRYLFLLKAESGWGHVRRIEEDGRIGEEIEG